MQVYVCNSLSQEGSLCVRVTFMWLKWLFVRIMTEIIWSYLKASDEQTSARLSRARDTFTAPIASCTSKAQVSSNGQVSSMREQYGWCLLTLVNTFTLHKRVPTKCVLIFALLPVAAWQLVRSDNMRSSRMGSHCVGARLWGEAIKRSHCMSKLVECPLVARMLYYLLRYWLCFLLCSTQWDDWQR